MNQAPTQDESNPYKQGRFDELSPYTRRINPYIKKKVGLMNQTPTQDESNPYNEK